MKQLRLGCIKCGKRCIISGKKQKKLILLAFWGIYLNQQAGRESKRIAIYIN